MDEIEDEIIFPLHHYTSKLLHKGNHNTYIFFLNLFHTVGKFFSLLSGKLGKLFFLLLLPVGVVVIWGSYLCLGFGMWRLI